jgi:hypothetical protein
MILVHFGTDRTIFQLTEPEQVNRLDLIEQVTQLGNDRTSDIVWLCPNHKLR